MTIALKDIRWTEVFASVVITLLVILIFIVFYNNKCFMNYLHGFWKTDSSFCEEANIDFMAITIGEGEGFTGGEHSAFLVMIKDGNSIDQKLTMKIKPSFSLLNPHSSEIFKVTLEGLDEDIMPSELIMECSLTDGKILLYDDEDNLYSELFKSYADSRLMEQFESNLNYEDSDD
jgi:hypothetical protein